MKIFASILDVDFLKLGEEIESIENAGVDGFHLDVMDGHFVPNISVGTPIAKVLREKTKLPVDVHLMVYEPEKFIDYFKDFADIFTIHVESSPSEGIRKIKRHGLKVYLSINPETDVDTLFPYLDTVDGVLIMSVHPGFGGQKFIKDVLKKGEVLKSMKDDIYLGIDGGVKPDVMKDIRDSGFDMVVVGSYIARSRDRKRALRMLRYV